MYSSSSLMMDSCRQRGTWWLLKMKPFICSEHTASHWLRQTTWLMGFGVFYLGFSDTDKGLLRRVIDHRAYKATPLFLLPKCNKRRLMAAKCISMSSQWLSDLFSLIASPQILYLGWPAPCEKHMNREYLIPAVILKLNNPQSKQNENGPWVGPCITEQPRSGK